MVIHTPHGPAPEPPKPTPPPWEIVAILEHLADEVSCLIVEVDALRRRITALERREHAEEGWMNAGNLGAKIQEAWREILETEAARGAARGAGGDAAQDAYEQALARFKHMQIEAFTVALGGVQLLTEQLAAHEARIAALERAVGGRDPERPRRANLR